MHNLAPGARNRRCPYLTQKRCRRTKSTRIRHRPAHTIHIRSCTHHLKPGTSQLAQDKSTGEFRQVRHPIEVNAVRHYGIDKDTRRHRAARQTRTPTTELPQKRTRQNTTEKPQQGGQHPPRESNPRLSSRKRPSRATRTSKVQHSPRANRNPIPHLQLIELTKEKALLELAPHHIHYLIHALPVITAITSLIVATLTGTPPLVVKLVAGVVHGAIRFGLKLWIKRLEASETVC